MKAITMRMQKSSRPLVILLATVIVIITSIVVANATQTITTPNAVNITYSLTAGMNSAVITPVTNRPVQVMGCCTTVNNDQSVGQVSLIHVPSNSIRWVGLESTQGASGAAITQGFGGGGGLHMVYIDGLHQVDIQVASADTIQIHNGTGGTATGNVTLIW
jgi:hypothetical protein